MPGVTPEVIDLLSSDAPDHAEERGASMILGENIAPEDPMISIDNSVNDKARRLGRMPRVKAESFFEITTLIDDRLAMHLVEAMLEFQKGPIAIATKRLEDERMVQWQRVPWNLPASFPPQPTPFALWLYELASLTSLLGDDGRSQVFFQSLRDRYASKFSRLFVLFYGVKQVALRRNNEVQRQFRQALAAGERLSKDVRARSRDWSDEKRSLWLAGLDHGIQVMFVDGQPEVAELLIECSKCVAWQPYSHQSHAIGFNVEGSGKRSGHSASDSWRLMLLEVSKVSPVVADAIIVKYPAMNLMVQAFEQRGELALADLIVSDRRTLGTALSSKLYQIFMSSDPNKVIH